VPKVCACASGTSGEPREPHPADPATNAKLTINSSTQPGRLTSILTSSENHELRSVAAMKVYVHVQNSKAD
jgi:hypothetical protein